MTFFSARRDDDSVVYTQDVDSEQVRRDRRARRRRGIGWGLISLAMLIVVVLSFAPSPYVVEQPGPVYNTLGVVPTADGDQELITVSGAEYFPTEGALDLLTVTVLGGPSRPASLFEVAMAWFDRSKSVQPVEKFFQPGVTSEQQREQAAYQMENSQQEAVAAALSQLGYDNKGTVTVAGVLEDSPSRDILLPNDVITSVDGQPITGLPDLRSRLAAHGTETDADIGIVRNGEAQTVQVRPEVRSGAVALGVGVRVTYDFPVDVDIQLPNVGGPSAGMMFALGIYDKLSEGALTGGATVAGTGTIDSAGTVGSIGGIRQKMYGARDAGATLFLAPAADCGEVVGHIPSGLDVVAVSTLAEAISAVQAVAGGTDPSTLPGCTPAD